MVLICPVVLILCGMAINWAQLQLVKTELQVATDVSCRAAGRTYNVTNSMGQARAKAQEIADKNLVGNAPIVIRKSDLERGISIRPSLGSRYDFIRENAGANSIRLTVAKNKRTPSGPVNLYFPMLGGISTADLQAQAIAAQVELDIALVIDRSGSMAYSIDEVANPYVYPANAPPGWDFGQPVPPGSRWGDTVEAVQIFLDELARYPQQKRISLTTYSTNATLETDLSFNHSPIVTALDKYTMSFNSGATNISAGLTVASNVLASSPASRPYANKVIVLMTDGIQNWGTNPISVAGTVSSRGVTIFTLTFSNEANQAAMKEVAKIARGSHFHATSKAMLKDCFRQIARKMPTVLVK
jgi:Mg-chelatase subunit ChlD